MNIPLSKRLQVCAGFVASGDRVADIGCDHGYLSIYLLKTKIASAVIAADINEMPLQSAKGNAERFGVSHGMQFFLSDGVKSIPREFDTLVCAGMGADTMVSILDAASWLQSSQYRLVLQCQSKTHLLRRYLSEQGWHIAKETLLRDGRFLYTVMEVLWQSESHLLTPGQWYFPPALAADTSPELPEYCRQLYFQLKRAANGQGDHVAPEILDALKELEKYPHLLEESL